MAKEQDAVRAYAAKKVKAQRDFKQYLWVWLAVSVLTTSIWAITGGGYFWPMWQMFGMGVGALFTGLDAYGKFSNKPITDEDIDKEIARLSK